MVWICIGAPICIVINALKIINPLMLDIFGIWIRAVALPEPSRNPI